MAGSSSKSNNTTRKRKASSSSGAMWSGSSGRKSKKKSGGSSGSGSSGGINETSAEKIFNDMLADEDDPHVAGMEGISKLCEELDIDPLEDIRVLVLLWKLGANDKPAQINKEEWMMGCQKLQADSIAKFKSILPSLDTGFLDQTAFKDFYKVCNGVGLIFLCCYRILNDCRAISRGYVDMAIKWDNNSDTMR